MNVPLSIADLQWKNVEFALESIDRMYLNAYVPQLTSAAGVASYFRHYKGHRFASTKSAAESGEAFRRKILQFACGHDIALLSFEKGQRKDDVAKEHLAKFEAEEGVLFIGKAQEKAHVPRTVRKKIGDGPGTFPWIEYSTAMVNFYYFYCVDADFGPFFIKFCSYFPYTAKLCINGHEYLKRQLAKRGIAFESLDNGLLRCSDTKAAQKIADGFDERKIEGFFRKWLRKLPHPYPAADRKAGYRYRLSILQAEFALTQVWDRPLHGREFFEEVIRENIDLGRPENVQLIFARRMQKKTATDGRCRTRIVTEGVIPSLHVYYKNTHLKQYHKTCARGAALRTETTINNTYDFGVGRWTRNLPELRKIGFAANRKMLEVEKASHDCRIGARAFQTLQQPVETQGQRSSALRFGDERVQAVFSVLLLFSLHVEGFRNRQLRPLLAQMLGLEERRVTQGRMSYELRRLRLHGLIERIPKSHRYRLTRKGLATMMYYNQLYSKLIRPVFSMMPDAPSANHSQKAKCLKSIQSALDSYLDLAAA